MATRVLIQNINNIDRKIWIPLPTTSKEIQEAINDICNKKGDTYIINKIEGDINIDLKKYNNLYAINKQIKSVECFTEKKFEPNRRLKLTLEERIISEQRKRDRMRINVMVKRKPEIVQHCCICGNENTQILHNAVNPYKITFICKNCRADTDKLKKAEKCRFDIRDIMDKSKMSGKTFSEKDVQNIVENYLFDVISIQDYCYKIGISRCKFNSLIERYTKLYDNPLIRKMIINHSNNINAKKLSVLALERNNKK